MMELFLCLMERSMITTNESNYYGSWCFPFGDGNIMWFEHGIKHDNTLASDQSNRTTLTTPTIV